MKARRPSVVGVIFLFLVFSVGILTGMILSALNVDPYDSLLESCETALNLSMSETVVCEAVLDYCTTGPINEECYKNIMEAQ